MGLIFRLILLGEPLVDVLAMGQARVHGYAVKDGAVEDGAVLMARSGSGALVQMHVAYNCPETLPRRRLEVVGTAGQAVATDTMGQTAGGILEVIDAATGVAVGGGGAGGGAVAVSESNRGVCGGGGWVGRMGVSAGGGFDDDAAAAAGAGDGLAVFRY